MEFADYRDAANRIVDLCWGDQKLNGDGRNNVVHAVSLALARGVSEDDVVTIVRCFWYGITDDWRFWSGLIRYTGPSSVSGDRTTFDVLDAVTARVLADGERSKASEDRVRSAVTRLLKHDVDPDVIAATLGEVWAAATERYSS